jgi:hypothetical protein
MCCVLCAVCCVLSAVCCVLCAVCVQVAADTTCEKQGIAPVPEKLCGHACLALGFKDTGPRARPDPPGCFVMAAGPYKGNCNYNSNKSATCEPPCKLYGVLTQRLCIRK